MHCVIALHIGLTIIRFQLFPKMSQCDLQARADWARERTDTCSLGKKKPGGVLPGQLEVFTVVL